MDVVSPHWVPNVAQIRKTIPDDIAAGSNQHIPGNAKPSEAEYKCTEFGGTEYKIG